MARVRKLLVCADGVTAVRVTRTVQELGLQSVTATTLDVAALVARAKEAGADALHPGFGALAQNVALARACEAAGITFIGASSSSLEAIAAAAATLDVSKLEAPHRVVFQVFADAFGNVVHLNEREGGGAIFESPSPILTNEQRAEAGAKAVQLARDVKLVGAASVEFFVDGARHLHFSRMTAGVPAEHAVTEWVCGIDLVTWQVHVAQGGLLPLTQQLSTRGHSIAVMVSAEHAFAGPFTRDDGGTLSVWAPTRPEAVRKLRRALAEAAGSSDAAKLSAMLQHETFMRGDADVAYFGAATT